MLSLFKLINYIMILYKLKSDLQMTPNLIVALNMAGSQGNHKKQLSQNTATAIYHICKGIVNLC